MRAKDFIGPVKTGLENAKNGNTRRVLRHHGKPITLKLLHNMRVRRERRDAELAVYHEFVKIMYGPPLCRKCEDESQG